MTRKLLFLAPASFQTAALILSWLFPLVVLFPALAQQLDVPLPPVEAEQKQVIADVKAKALDFEKNLPDFTCTQFSHHSVDVKAVNQWKTTETINEQLVFSKGQAQYKLVAVNGKKAGENDKPPASAVPVSEFIKLMHDIFDPGVKAGMAWNNWDSVRGHRVHMITFVVTAENSQYTVGKSKGVQTGLAGFIYADADTNMVLRIVVAPTGIPKNYPIQAVSIDMNYDFGRIGDKVYLLPLKADFRQKEGKGQIWDEVELKDFRKP